MHKRYFKAWLWKAFGITLMLCIVPTIIFIVVLSVRWKTNLPFVNNLLTKVQHSSYDEDANKTHSLPDTELLDKVIMRRFPYMTDPVCQNFSVRLYEEDTFNITGLISYPGSGNTWARHLIHLSTGVYTGSFYFDMDLFSKGFLGEREPWYSGSTIVQKFHERYKKDLDVRKAILIIREPFPAILSFANFLEAGHTGNAHVLPYHHQDWPKFILCSAYNWLSLAKSWIESPVSLLVIHYEHLRLQPVENLRKICDFLRHSCPYLHHPCFQRRLEGSFRRVNSLPLRTQKDVARKARYPPEIRELVSRGSDHLNNLLKERGHEPLPLNLYQYYSPSSE